MQDLKQKLADQGLVGTLTIRETGQKIPLRFGRGETSKLCKLELGPTSVDAELRLTPVVGAKPGQPNLTLTFWTGDVVSEEPVVVTEPEVPPTKEPEVPPAKEPEPEVPPAKEPEDDGPSDSSVDKSVPPPPQPTVTPPASSRKTGR